MKIIARHNEEITEVGYIVQKDIHLPNIGREASSYLWYIVTYYNDLEGLYEFRQAKSSDHKVNEFDHVCDLKGRPHHHYDLPIEKIAKMIDLKIPNTLYFTAGAQFDVDATQIKARSKEWYENAYKVSMEEPDAPWVFERLWKYIFNI